jgi:aryl-alcohol dehydrogenase-like predicted oxidoreductase
MTEPESLPLFTLGPRGPKVGSIGIGTWAWGDRRVWGYGDDYDASDVQAAYDACASAGITFYDTAEAYGWGKSEELLGKFIRTGSDSRQIQVATKWFPFPWRLFPRRSILRSLQASLERLGLPAVDLYQIHWPSPLVGIKAAMDGMADAVEQGLTRAVGVSNFNAEQTRRAHSVLAERGIPLATNQIQYSLVHRQPEFSGLLDTCRELAVTVIAYSPLGMGTLTGKYTPDQPLTGARARRYDADFLARLQPLLDRMREIGQQHGNKTPSQVAINWVIAHGAIPIPGAKNARQAEENVGAMGWSLTADEVAALDELSASLSH